MRSIVIDVASLTHDVVLPDGVTGSVFRSYDEALAQSSAPLVDVSTRNHDHLALVLRALASGRHVVIDKPAALSVAEVEQMVAAAAAAGRLIAEATVWSWHPQIQQLSQLIADAGPLARPAYAPFELRRGSSRGFAAGEKTRPAGAGRVGWLVGKPG